MIARWDAHIHLFERGFEGTIAAGVAEYEALRASEDVDGALVVGYEGGERYRGNNAYVRALAQTRDWIHPLAYVPCARVPSPDDLEGLRADGFVGLAVYADEAGSALSAWGDEQFGAAALDGAIVSVNATPGALALASAWVARLNGAQVLVSHLGLPGATASLEETRTRLSALAELRRHPHVSVKLSGLYAIDPVFPYAGARVAAELVLEWFGPERVVWGSDFSPALGFGSPSEIARFPAWLEGVLTRSEREQVEAGNLRSAIDRARR